MNEQMSSIILIVIGNFKISVLKIINYRLLFVFWKYPFFNFVASASTDKYTVLTELPNSIQKEITVSEHKYSLNAFFLAEKNRIFV